MSSGQAEALPHEAERSQARPAEQHATSVDPLLAEASATESSAPEEGAQKEGEVSDPDEDDLDDLDDVLDEFSSTSISNKPAPVASGPGRPSEPAAATGVPALPDDDEFARSLQAGMAELLGEFESNPDMQKQFEELVRDLGEGMSAEGLGSALGGSAEQAASDTATPTPAATSAAPAAASTTSPKSEPNFQDTIRQTMERMNASSAAATSASAQSASNAEEDFLAAMLREMEQSGPDGLGLGSDEDFSKMLLGMMEQLTNKDILYEPMKELHDKFPVWMDANRGNIEKSDLERYTEQQRLVKEIVGKFEEKGYTDENGADREYIVERMQQMQAAGSPPPDLVGDMNAATEALGGMDGGCPQQ